MNKILLALTILGAGGGAFHTARQATSQLRHEADATREVWLAQTQRVAAAQNDQSGLLQRIRELKEALAQAPAVGENALWSALQTNHTGHLPPELRERLLEELGFNWNSSEDFIVVSKQTGRDLQMGAIRGGKLTDMAATVLAMTPEERGQVETAMRRVPTDISEWALTHVERSEPKDDVVAQYTLPNDPGMSVSNNFATGLFGALGRERAELILASAYSWMHDIEEPWTMIVKRYPDGNEQRLKEQVFYWYGTPRQGQWVQWDGSRPGELSKVRFPSAFLPIFPNGWADVAKREGFELPEEPEKK